MRWLLWGCCSLTLVLGVSVCDEERVARTRASLGNKQQATKCPDASWKTEFYSSATIQQLQRPVVIFDIGCNKGYDTLNALKLYTQDARVDFRRYAALSFGGNCGACNQCRDDAPLHPHLAKKAVSLHCIEPLPANFQQVNRSASAMHLDELGLRVVNAAFTNAESAKALGGYLPLPAGPHFAGSENFGIGHNGGWTAPVPKPGKGGRHPAKAKAKAKGDALKAGVIASAKPVLRMPLAPPRTSPSPLAILPNSSSAASVRWSSND